MSVASGWSVRIRNLTRYEVGLILLFCFTLPFMNPWVRGDGVGYYAFARSVLIEHNLDFSKDWQHANASFRMGRIDADGSIDSSQYTRTGHLDNHFSIGPAILWAPFLIVAHAGVLISNHFGARVAADGFSRPYLLAIAFGTALYGFLAIFISFVLARRYVAERWAFLAAAGIWFGSSLPVYMYFDPSWSHAQSAFAVALFVWYWLRTRGKRTVGQWAIFGALAGLMMDVYYPNALLLLLPLFDSLGTYGKSLRRRELGSARSVLAGNLSLVVTAFLAFAPTLIVKKIVYGSYVHLGYGHLWNFAAPALLDVPFSADHGLFSWTPILVIAVTGLFLLYRLDRRLSLYSVAVLVAFFYTIGCYADWDGLSSFGNRFFISLTIFFVIGLGTCFDFLTRVVRARSAAIVSCTATAVLVLWNLGLIFQWGMHLIPPRGPISWRAAAYNQVEVIPQDAASAMKMYFTRRSNLMRHIERTDVEQLKNQQQSKIE